MSTNETNNLASASTEENTELLTREDVDGTPFVVIGTQEGYFGVLGKYRITELDRSKKKIVDELKSVNWNRIIQIILILIEKQR